MERFLLTQTMIVELLLIGIFIAIAVQQLIFPYLVALVLVGLAMALPQPPEVNLPFDLILALSIPPLLFGTSRRIHWSELRGNLISVLILVLPGVILSTLIVGWALTLFTPLALPVAFVFGALISATDPFALGVFLRNSGISRTLAVLINSEGLLNTALAIIVFNLVIASTLTEQFQFLHSLGEFIRVLVGGVAVGLILGWLISKLVSWGNDNLMETVLTTLLPFVAYLLAERVHVSGALSVVAAGLINGTLRSQSTISRPWVFLAFVANSLIFLLMGLQINLSALLGASQAVLLTIAAVILVRALVIYGLNRLLRPRTDRLPMTWLHVWNLIGFRGAIGMALVLSLPEQFNESRELLNLLVFGVVLFSVLVQSTSIRSFRYLLDPENQRPEQMEP